MNDRTANTHRALTLHWSLVLGALAVAACGSLPEPYRPLDTRVLCDSPFAAEVTLDEAVRSLDRDGNQVLDELDAGLGEAIAIVEIRGRHRESVGRQPRRGVAMYSSWTGLARRTDSGMAIEMTLACSPTAELEVVAESGPEGTTRLSSFTFTPLDSEAHATAAGVSFEGDVNFAEAGNRVSGRLEGTISAPLVAWSPFDDGSLMTGQSIMLHQVAFNELEIAQ